MEQAENLNMPKVRPEHILTKMLFYSNDVVRAWVNEEGNIIITTADESYYAMEYEEKIWKKLEKCFERTEKQIDKNER